MKRLMTLICISFALISMPAHSDNLFDKLKKELDKVQDKSAVEYTSAAEAGNPVVLTVDGISLFKKNQRMENSYLKPVVDGWAISDDVSFFGWSGNYAQTESELTSLENKLVTAFNRAKSEGRPFVIVAHSWGTVLSYRALKNLYAAGRLPENAVHAFVSMGSPLSKADDPNYEGKKLAAGPGFAYDTNVTGAVLEYGNWTGSEALDKVVGKHKAYYTAPSMASKIRKQLVADLQNFAPQVSEPPVVASTPPTPVLASNTNTQPVEPTSETPSQTATSNASTTTDNRRFVAGSLPYNPNHLAQLQYALQANGPKITCVDCLLGGVNMSAKELTDMNFAKLTAPCANFSNSNFYKENDQTQRITSTEKTSSFRDAYLVRSNFSSSKLKKADFTRATLIGAQFGGADLEGAGLAGVQAVGANFANASLVGASLKGAELFGANFRGANLKDGSLEGASLEPQDLAGAIMCNTTMPNGAVEYGGCNGGAMPQTTFTNPSSPPAEIWLGMKQAGTAYELCGKQEQGTEVTDVEWGGPTWAAGLRRRDIIQHIEDSNEDMMQACETIPQSQQHPENIAKCKENVSRRLDRYMLPSCDQMYYFKSKFGRHWVAKEKETDVALRGSGSNVISRDGETVEFFVVRDASVSILPITFGLSAMLQTSTVACPSPTAMLAAGRPAPRQKASAGSYRGATLESIVYRGDPAMKVLSVEQGSEMEVAGVKAGDILTGPQPQHIRYGDIDTAEKLTLMEQDTYDRNPNNPQTPFSILVTRGKQQYWIYLDHRKIPR